MTAKNYAKIVRELETELTSENHLFTDGWDELALDVLRYRQDEMKDAENESELWQRVRIFITAAAVEMRSGDCQSLYYASTNQYGVLQRDEWERILEEGVNYEAKVVREADWRGGYNVRIEGKDYELADFDYVEWEGDLRSLFASGLSFEECVNEVKYDVDAVALFI